MQQQGIVSAIGRIMMHKFCASYAEWVSCLSFLWASSKSVAACSASCCLAVSRSSLWLLNSKRAFWLLLCSAYTSTHILNMYPCSIVYALNLHSTTDSANESRACNNESALTVHATQWTEQITLMSILTLSSSYCASLQ